MFDIKLSGFCRHIFILSFLGFSSFSFSSPGLSSSEFNTIVESMPEEKKDEIIYGTGSGVEVFNYETGEADYIQRFDKVDDEQAIKYIPPVEGASELYFGYRDSGDMEPFEALITTISDIHDIIN